jgi:5-(carboxyamino)imidazole ribonucleotide synthase
MQHFEQDFKLGILGGGQLGRMLIQAGIDFNLDIHILDPDINAPCRSLASEFTQGELTDFDTVYNFGKSMDVLTIEIENVNTEALKKLEEEGVRVFPQPDIIRLIQDKRTQKMFYQQYNIPTAEFILTETQSDVIQHADFLPAVHKLAKAGYDGRGVQKINTVEDAYKAFEAPGLLEKLIDFDKEISVIVARCLSGEVAVFPIVELVFHPEHNLVEYLIAPAMLPLEVEAEATRTAIDVIEKLKMVGLLAVEMFVTKDGRVLVNEIAPRPHNSGHQTIKANYTSQFEQHLRAILNMPLGSTFQTVPSAMVNLLGEEGYTGPANYEGLDKVLRQPGVHIHLYGKKITKPYRKMGHVTILAGDRDMLVQRVKFIKENIKVKA